MEYVKNVPPPQAEPLYAVSAGKSAFALKVTGAALAGVWAVIALCVLFVEPLRQWYYMLICFSVAAGCLAVAAFESLSAVHTRRYPLLVRFDQTGIVLREGWGYRVFLWSDLGVVTIRTEENGEELVGRGGCNMELSVRALYYETDGKAHVLALCGCDKAAAVLRERLPRADA